MKQVVVDTNFVVSCVRSKIDFLEKIYFMGYEILVPEQVLFELRKIILSEKKLKLREEAEIALKILSKAKLKKIDLGVTFVDKGLIKYAKANPNVIIATLDAELRTKIKNRKMRIYKQNQLEIF